VPRDRERTRRHRITLLASLALCASAASVSVFDAVATIVALGGVTISSGRFVPADRE